MARHAASPSQRRALLRAGLTVTAVGAALGLGGAAAQAAAPAAPHSAADTDTPLGEAGGATVKGLGGALPHALAGGVGPVTNLKLDPLAGTGVDPLDNAVGTQVADFQPVSTAAVTAPVTDGGALKDLPVVGTAAALLPSLPG
jgi:hypothetical protein